MNEPRSTALNMTRAAALNTTRAAALDTTTAAAPRPAADLVLMDTQPTVMALYRHEATSDQAAGLVAWVIGLPDGTALILSPDTSAASPILTTLANVSRRWTRQMQADLVHVTTHDALRLVA